MSGHNKFSKIKRKKEVEDAKKSKVFSGLVKQIALESKHASGNKNSPGLRLAIEKARALNMPGENIDRAVAKGRKTMGSGIEEILCEAYGPGGVAIIIEGTTDNRNRTINEIKFILSETGASLGSQGSVVWAFQKLKEGFEPKTLLSLSQEDEEKLMTMKERLEENPDIDNIYTNVGK